MLHVVYPIGIWLIEIEILPLELGFPDWVYWPVRLTPRLEVGSASGDLNRKNLFKINSNMYYATNLKIKLLV